MTKLKQLNIKAIGCDPKRIVKQTGGTLFLARIFGEATAAKIKPGKSGDPFAVLVGGFRAIVPAPAQLPLEGTPPDACFESDTIILPAGLDDPITNLLRANKGKGVLFAYDVSAVKDPASPLGYSYSAALLVKPRLADNVTALTASLSAVPYPSILPKPEATDGPAAGSPPVAAPPAPAAPKPAAPKPAPRKSRK